MVRLPLSSIKTVLGRALLRVGGTIGGIDFFVFV